MTLLRTLSLLALLLWLSACASSAEVPSAPAPTTAKVLLQADVVTASAEVVPAQVSRLSFPLSGRVSEVRVRAGQRVSAGETLIILEQPELSGAVAQAEAALQSARKEYEYYLVPRRQPPVFVNPRKPWHGLTAGPLEPPERLWLAQARLSAAERALESARAFAAQTVLVAPFDGVVTAVNVAPGEVLGAAQTALILADLDRLQVETTDLSEQYIASIRPGQTVNVYIEALDRDFKGQVMRIAPRAYKEGGDVYFRVTVALDTQPPGALWGMSAEVQIAR